MENQVNQNIGNSPDEIIDESVSQEQVNLSQSYTENNLSNEDENQNENSVKSEENNKNQATKMLDVDSLEKKNNNEQKTKSKFNTFFENLNYRLSYTPALGFVGVMSIVCFLGFLFFLNERKLFEGNEQIVSSCLLFQIFFGIATALFLILFISSIVLNIIRRKQGKR